MDLIKGKIAAIVNNNIINNKQIVINRGKNHAVTVDMLFSVRLYLPDIVDPDDKNNKLTGIYYEKGRLRVTQVYENMSFALLQAYKVINPEIPTSVVSAYAKIIDKYPDVDSTSLVSSLDWVIKVGDEVIQVKED
jgi:hypothetical protein